MATIIRRNSSQEAPTGRAMQTVAFNFSDMRGQADEYLGSVRAEAAKIVQQAHQQAEQIRRQAEIAGRKAAEAAIERILDEKVAKQMQTLLPALEQLMHEMNDMKGALLAEWERSAVHVAKAIAERVIRREVSREPQITIDLVAETLRLAAGAADITLQLNPADYENLRDQVERVAATVGQLAPAAIVAEESVGPGGCRVKTRFGEIDNRIETQLRRIEEELT